MRFTYFTLLVLATASRLWAEPVETQGRLESVSRPDPNKSFNLSHSGISAGRSFQTDSFKGKNFYVRATTAPKTFESRDFLGARKASTSSFTLPKSGPNIDAINQIPNATRQAETKTAETKEARDSGKTVATRATTDADRPYLGPESKKLDRAVDPTKPLPQTMQSGHVMTLEEIRELLNKNK